FEVKCLCGRETGVAGTQQNTPVGQLQSLQNLLGVARQPFVLQVGLFRPRELDQFNLLELVLADDAAGVFARCAGLGAEAWSVSREPDRQPRLVEYFISVEVGYRNLSRWDQPVIIVLELASRNRVNVGVGTAEEVFGELGQLAGA